MAHLHRPITVICVYLFLAPGLVSPVHVMEYSAGDVVTIDCQKGCNKSVTRDDINQITWRKYNNSHFLLFANANSQTFSNFSESFFQDPLILRITDAQPSDSGNYTCDIAAITGLCFTQFSLHVSDLVPPVHVMEYSAGDTVTIDCRERCNKSVNKDDITLITWRKYNNSHFLLFANANNRTFSNFSESSFQDPLILRITDAQPSDSGNYTCEISSLRTGYCNPLFSLHVSGKSLFYPNTWRYIRWISFAIFVVICLSIWSVLLFHK